MHAYSDGPTPPNLLRTHVWAQAIPYDTLPMPAADGCVLLHFAPTADWQVSVLTPLGLVRLVLFHSLVSRS